MTWTKFIVGVKKVWSFLRRHGRIIIVGLVLVVAMAGFQTARGRHVIGRLWSLIKRERELHHEEVEELDKIHDEELRRRSEAARRALEAVRQAEEQYRDREDKLDARRRRKIRQLVERSDDEPSELARKLADEYNFTYVP